MLCFSYVCVHMQSNMKWDFFGIGRNSFFPLKSIVVVWIRSNHRDVEQGVSELKTGWDFRLRWSQSLLTGGKSVVLGPLDFPFLSQYNLHVNAHEHWFSPSRWLCMARIPCSVMGTGATLRNWLSATDTNPKGSWEKGFFDLCPDWISSELDIPLLLSFSSTIPLHV